MNYLVNDEKSLVEYIDSIYPVGSIYMSTNSTSPSILFGGTWKALDEGRALIGANPTYPVNSKGGEATHTLAINEMPSHTHEYTASARYGRDGTTISSGQWSAGDSVRNSQTATFTETGGSQPHNNMQPYLAVYMWERTG